MKQKITPNLWFDTQAEEAAAFYTSVFKNSRILNVTHYTEAGRRLAWRTTSGAVAHGVRVVEPAGGGRCRLTLELNVTASGVSWLLSPVLRHVLRRNLRRDVERLAALVADESRAVASSVPA